MRVLRLFFMMKIVYHTRGYLASGIISEKCLTKDSADDIMRIDITNIDI